MLLLEDKVSKIANIIDNEIRFNDAIVSAEDGDWSPAMDYFYYHKGLRSAVGMTKVVAIDDSSSKVIKMPIWGAFYDEDDLDEDDRDIIEYECANDREYSDDPSSNWNYLENEIKKYEEIKEDGFAEFFVEVEFYRMSKNGLPLYIQDRVNRFDVDYNEVKNSNSYKKATEMSTEISKKAWVRVNEYFIASCIDYYGEERTEEFLKYITFTKPELGSDLHSKNLGFTIDGRPVVLDFGAFREEI